MSTYGADEHLWCEAEDERAAIVEHDGGAPREWAEGFAWLDPDRPPGDVPPQRWLRFVTMIGRFSIVGLRFRPQRSAGDQMIFSAAIVTSRFTRIDRAGLLWLLNGNWLVALTADAAVIDTRRGAWQTYRRKPSEPGRVRVWELVFGKNDGII